VSTRILSIENTPLSKLISEALYRVRETLAVFPDVVLLKEQGQRCRVLRDLIDTDGIEVPEVDCARGAQVILCARHQPPSSSGTPFGWCSDSGPLMIYPLADWNENTVKAYLGEQNEFRRTREVLKLCVVGDSDTGKSDLITGLTQDHKTDRQESPRPGYLWTDSRLLIMRETRGKHASDLAVMATAWESDWSLLVVDAEQGLTDVTRRLLFLLALSGVPQLVVTVTRLSNVENPEACYESLVGQINHSLTNTVQLNLTAVIPEDSEAFNWYSGESLMSHLNRVVFPDGDHLQDLRIPVQHSNGKTVRGRVSGGLLAEGDEIVLLPSGTKSKVRGLKLGNDEPVERALTGDSVTIEFESKPESEGENILVSESAYPAYSSDLDATLLWVGGDAPGAHASYRLYHQAHLVSSRIVDVQSCLQPNSYEWSEGDTLAEGIVGHVHLTTGSPLYFDSFFQNRHIGRFLMLHPEKLEVVGLGILRGELRKRHEVTSSPERLSSEHVVVDPTEVGLDQRRKQYGHRGAVLWFTGLSGSGKSAAAKKTEKALFERGCHTLFLDGDNVRTGFNGDLGFTVEERSESNRRVAELAALVCQQGQIVICSFISGSKEDRDFARSLVDEDFYLCYVDCPVEVCRQRDPKGLYERADAGELLSFTGVSLPYDEPEDAELTLDSTKHDPEALSANVVRMLEKKGVIGAKGVLENVRRNLF
jgi:bifunctional enzyme CysN/CysC